MILIVNSVLPKPSTKYLMRQLIKSYQNKRLVFENTVQVLNFTQFETIIQRRGGKQEDAEQRSLFVLYSEPNTFPPNRHLSVIEPSGASI